MTTTISASLISTSAIESSMSVLALVEADPRIAVSELTSYESDVYTVVEDCVSH